LGASLHGVRNIGAVLGDLLGGVGVVMVRFNSLLNSLFKGGLALHYFIYFQLEK
jgi:hypothetical protein